MKIKIFCAVFLLFAFLLVHSGCKKEEVNTKKEEVNTKKELDCKLFQGINRQILAIKQNNVKFCVEVTRRHGRAEIIDTTFYNESGLCVKLIRRITVGPFMEKYLYDKNEDIIEESRYSIDSILLFKNFYFYDKNGFLTEKKTYYADKDTTIFFEKYNYVVDSICRPVKKQTISENNILQWEFRIKYDLNNEISEERSYYQGNELVFYSINEYDDKGNIKKNFFRHYDQKLWGEYERRTLYYYNEKGLLIKTEEYDEKNILTEEVVYKYY